MNQNISTEWSKTERIIFRLAFCYLVFYFLFLSNYFVSFFPFLERVQSPLQYISDSFVGFVNRLFIHKEYEANIYTGAGDTSWFCIAIFSYFVMAILATIVWTIFDKRNNYQKLFICLQVYSRYYLAFVLFLYGFGKLFGAQFFDPTPINLIQPLGNIDHHALLWTFMGASKLYNFFGGLVEVIAGALLLFRRSTTLGALIAIATLINILMLDIAYDTLVKAFAAHFIMIGFFILSPDVKRLLNFFLLNRNTSLAANPFTTSNKKLRWVKHSLKFILIAYVVFTSVKVAVKISDNYLKPYFGSIDGIYEIKEFNRSQQSLQQISTDTISWKKIAINKFGEMAVQYMNDSVVYYDLKVDTTTKSLALSSWNDSTFNSNLHYTFSSPDEYLFEGPYKNDTIRFISKKIDLNNFPLLKDKGKVKWVYW